MSSTPTSPTETETEGGETITLARRVRDQADRALGLVRDNPKTAIATGAALGGAKTPARKRAPKRTPKKS
jgi:hypothetical protein